MAASRRTMTSFKDYPAVWISFADRLERSIRFTGVPVLIDGERPDIRPPPRLGEHTRAILEEIRFPPCDIEVLSNQPAVAADTGEPS